jgi:fructosamine-3-kinase
MDRHLAEAIGRALGAELCRVRPVYGGDVAISYRAELADGRVVFAKTHRNPTPGFFTTEAQGLQWLGAAGSIGVPEVLAVADEPAFLVLSWIEAGTPASTTEAEFGHELAALHRSGAPSFGREDRRTTGSRRLPNDPAATWSEFYATRRLLPLARLARDAAALPPTVIAGLETLAGRLEELGGPAEPPARLHGDLWSNNRLVGAGGRNWLIDPAAHGGHREFDLAMMRLFGGFSEACFAAYEESHPLADGWRERVALHQIAPLVVHAIKFGGGYRASAAAAIARYA